MSLYVMVWIVLCVFGLGDFFFKASYKTKRVEFICLVVFLSIILVFRFGQGQDYFSYRYIYNQMPQNGFDFSVYKTVHGEIGYLILCNFFRCLHIPFEGFIACTALFEMVCFYFGFSIPDTLYDVFYVYNPARNCHSCIFGDTVAAVF